MKKWEAHILDTTAQAQARDRWNSIAKPLYSLGVFEDMVVQIAGIQETPDVRLDRRCALIFCADHGVVSEGVSQTGSDVTALVARSIADGTANINLMAQTAGVDVFSVDMGMVRRYNGAERHHPKADLRNGKYRHWPGNEPRTGAKRNAKRHRSCW